MNEQDLAIREFLAESYENLDQLEHDLITIEDDPTNCETLARIFRTIHSIKGACGFLAYPKLEAVAHAGEGLLGRLRDGALAWRPDITSGLLALSDTMRTMLRHIEADACEGDESHGELIGLLVGLQDANKRSAPGAGTMVPEEHRPDACTIAHRAPERTEAHAVSESSGERPGLVNQSGVQERDLPTAVSANQDVPASAISGGNIRVDVGLLDKLMNLVGELVLARNQILQHASSREDATLLGTSQRLNLITSELQEGVMKTRMQPMGTICNKFPRVVRDLALACGKHVRVEIEGSETELDRTIIEAIKDPLTHLVRNAVDHGIESPEVRARRGKAPMGCLRIRAFHESGQVNIEIADDGAGIDFERVSRRALERGLITREQAARMGDQELLQLIFIPGFSTAECVTNVSGRGVGLDVVKTNIEKIGGTIEMQSRSGLGTTLKIKIPLTLAIIPALIVTAGGECFAIPQVSLLELVRLEREQARRGIETIRGAPIFRLRGNLLPLVHLDQMMGLGAADVATGNGREVTKVEDVDFAALREMHLRWRGRLQRFLQGKEQLDADQLASPDQCELGRWLNSPANRRLIERPEFVRLIRSHNALHAAVKDVVVSHHADRRIDANMAMERVEAASIEVVAALASAERLVESDGNVNIVVLQADGRRFGLVVDGINDTEEIVVKPLGKQLKGLALFAGATIMGDGRVSLILDVSGIAHRAGVHSAMERLVREEERNGQKHDDERSSYLLLRHGPDGRAAIPLSHVARLEEIPRSAIEYSSECEVVQYRDQIIPLVRLSRALNRSDSAQGAERDPMQVVIYTQKGRSVGLVVDEILDIVEDSVQVRPFRSGKGLLGSAVIQQRVTDVLDVPGLIQVADPNLIAAQIGLGD